MYTFISVFGLVTVDNYSSLDACHLLTDTTPHIGSAEESTRKAMAELVADNMIGGLTTGQMPKRLV